MNKYVNSIMESVSRVKFAGRIALFYTKDKELKDETVKQKREAYKKYLDKLLQKDYSFYKLYSASKWMDLIKKTGGFALISSPSAIKKIAMLKIAQIMGITLSI